MMHAIVLTFDKHIRVAGLVTHTYQTLWPENPFCFRIPYNDAYPEFLKERYGDKVELIKTRREIRNTMETLLEGISDDEWVWWCMDDKYLVRIDQAEATRAYVFVTGLADQAIGGVMISKNNGVNKYLVPKDILTSPEGQIFIRKKNYHNFYQHYFIRARILRRVFLDRSYRDDYKLTDRDNVSKTIGIYDNPQPETIPGEKMYVPECNMVIFGESLHEGRLTTNCVKEFERYGLEKPPLEVTNYSWILEK